MGADYSRQSKIDTSFMILLSERTQCDSKGGRNASFKPNS
jgi:hypothetical protein